MNTKRWVRGAGLAVVGVAAAGTVASRSSGAARSLDLRDTLVNDPALPVMENPWGG